MKQTVHRPFLTQRPERKPDPKQESQLKCRVLVRDGKPVEAQRK